MTALLILFGDSLGGYLFTAAIILSQISTNGFAMMQVIKLVDVSKILDVKMRIILDGNILMLVRCYFDLE